MKCPAPDCGGDTNIPKTNTRIDGSQLRKRVCKSNPDHVFTTVEWPTATALENLGVKRSGDHKIRPFSEEKLLGQVRDAVNGAISESEIQLIVNGVLERLKRQLPTIRRWDQATHPDSDKIEGRLRAYIDDTDLRDIVEEQLRGNPNRIAVALYAIAVRGRRDRAGRTGWTGGAKDFINWIDEHYPPLRQRLPEPPGKRYRWEWSPVAPPTRPSQVVKAGRVIVGRPPQTSRKGHTAVGSVDVPEFEITEVIGRLVAFDESRLVGSIRRALFGHPNAEEWSRWIAWWVLREMAGQHRVSTSQLSVGVLNTLRMVDDLAYLRWAARLKHTPQVKALRAEAVALIQYPSDELEFRSPRMEPRNYRNRTRLETPT